jgi:exodeoxyribonuclease VII small subunit
MTTKKLKITEKLAELNKILESFEKNQPDLDKSIEDYKKATKIIKELEQELSAKELELKEIRTNLIE